MNARRLTERRKLARKARDDLSLYIGSLHPGLLDSESASEMSALKHLLALRAHVEELIELNHDVTGYPLITPALDATGLDHAGRD
jgi:hypothetical protein